MFKFSNSRLVSLARTALPVLGTAVALAWGGAAAAATMSYGFEGASAPGWTTINNSSPLGTTGWGGGDPVYSFSAQGGTAGSYLAADLNSTTGAHGTISAWLITPTQTFSNGDVLSFFTRTVDGLTTPGVADFPDRLEVRFSNVGGKDVGSTATSVGSFTNVLLTVNPDLTGTGYPTIWTQYNATISGLAAPTLGAIALRYFVTDGGPASTTYSNYIGIDTFSVTAAPVPESSTWVLMALGLGLVALRSKRSR